MTFALALVVAAISGFIALSYEILWYRVIAFASWGLPGAFGLLLAAYLFGLAIGSRVAGAFCKDDAKAGDRRQLRSLAIFAFVANVVAWTVVPFFGWSAKEHEWPPALILVALSAALLGAILPLVAHFGISADDRAGQRLSYVYLANIVGSAAGSLVTGFVFLDFWPLHTIGTVIAIIGLLLVAFLLWLSDLGRSARVASLVVLAIVGFVTVRGTPLAYDRIWERLLYKSKMEADTKFYEIIETKSGVITVTQDGTVYGGGAYDGRFNTSIVHDRNGILRAYGIGALHPAPKKVLMIGLASGSWATVIEHLPGLQHLTVVEINPGYTKLVANHAEVAGILRDPKVEIVIDDGRRWLHRHPDERFDVIVMNTTWHWRAHITNLLSTEFMELARAHLLPGGLFYFNTTSSLDVKKTAVTTFPYAMRVYNFMAVSDAPLTFDKGRWERTLAGFTFDGQPAIDRSTPDGQKFFDDLVSYADTINAEPTDEGLESRQSLLTPASGALATALKLDAAGVTSQGAAAASPAAFMSALILNSQSWATFKLMFDPDNGSGNAQKYAFAVWNGQQNNRYVFVCADTDPAPTQSSQATSSLGYLLAQAAVSGTCLVWEQAGQGLAAFICGAAASIDFRQLNGRITFKFKGQSGLVAGVTDQTTAANLEANGYNYYGAFGPANPNFLFFSPGTVTGPFLWLDSYINEVWLNSAFLGALVNLLTKTKSIPYNAAGRGMIEAALKAPIDAGLAFGAFRAGVTLSPVQIAQVNAAAGKAIDRTLSNRGWYLQVGDAAPSARAARGSPPCTFWYVDGQSVQKINLTSVAVQ